MSLLKALWSGHSHSIVAGTPKYRKSRDLFRGFAKLTVRSTAKNFRLSAIDGRGADLTLAQLAQVLRLSWSYLGTLTRLIGAVGSQENANTGVNALWNRRAD
jgi:hypothetical protein